MAFIPRQTNKSLPDFPSDIVKYKKDYREEKEKTLEKNKKVIIKQLENL